MTEDHGDKGQEPALRMHFALPDEAATRRLGARLAGLLGPRDTLLLIGPLGAGKSELARAIIRARLDEAEAEVPSPSYTLVNVYETPAGEIWHADLYRLAGGDEELAELGLEEAFGRALVLVEWGERLGARAPSRRIEATMMVEPAGRRQAELAFFGPNWAEVATMLAPAA